MMQGKIERFLECPVAGRKVMVVEFQETAHPTMSCCLSSRIVLTRCEEEEGCRQRNEAILCPLWDDDRVT